MFEIRVLLFSKQQAPDPAGSGEAATQLMGSITAEVQELLQELQDLCKAELDASLRDVQFAVGD